MSPVPFRRFVLYFLHLGTTGFGGPIATVGYIQRDLVEKRRWIGRKDFLRRRRPGPDHAPGPLAAQVAMWVGYLNRGPFGALAVSAAGYKLLKLTDRRDLRLWGISAAVFAVTALTGSEPVPMILAAGS
jgi:chromate transporter